MVEDCRQQWPAMTLPDRVHDHRNRCSRSTGIGVHHRLERVFTIDWNWCSRSAGTRTRALSEVAPTCCEAHQDEFKAEFLRVLNDCLAARQEQEAAEAPEDDDVHQVH